MKNQIHHDTEQLPPGGFYFAPGAIQASRRTDTWARALLVAIVLLALAALVGCAAAWAGVKGFAL